MAGHEILDHALSQMADGSLKEVCRVPFELTRQLSNDANLLDIVLLMARPAGEERRIVSYCQQRT